MKMFFTESLPSISRDELLDNQRKVAYEAKAALLDAQIAEWSGVPVAEVTRRRTENPVRHREMLAEFERAQQAQKRAEDDIDHPQPTIYVDANDSIFDGIRRLGWRRCFCILGVVIVVWAVCGVCILAGGK